MGDSPLLTMRGLGQGVWLRGLRRSLADSGVLSELIAAYGVSGVDTDLVVLAGAVARGPENGSLLTALAATDESRYVEELLVEESRVVADVLRSVHEETQGRDGYVSVDVDPSLADDAEALSRSVHRMLEAASRENVMVRLPPTESGLAVFEALTAEGLGVQLGPVFSLDGVSRATDAYVRGATRRLRHENDQPLPHSLVSFGLASLDIAIDEALREQMRAALGDTSSAEALLGSAGLAVAKVARRQHGDRLSRDLGSRASGVDAALRLAWTDLAEGDPRRRRQRYVESLIGPDTVAVLRPGMLRRMAQGPAPEATLVRSVDEAREILDELTGLGIDSEVIGAALERQARRRQDSDYRQLHGTLAACVAGNESDKERAHRAVLTGSPWWAAHPETPLATGLTQELDERRAVARMWAKDATLWADDEEGRELVGNRLGWLDLVDTAAAEDGPALRFAASLRDADIEHVVVLGMGGSSLCAEVCRQVFGAEGLHVLDSTLPDQIAATADAVDPARTLTVVASKSGTTAEVRALLDYFYARAAPILERPGDRFVAITDPGTPLEQTAHERGFRRQWLTPRNVGGRFSALTAFGTLPMALMGVDPIAVRSAARRMAAACAPEVSAASNPAARLAAALHGALLQGRDKLTFVSSRSMAPFGLWAEQLVAESTGKQGLGVVPIIEEPAGAPARYSDDRVFVSLRLSDDNAADHRSWLDALESEGHPVLRIVLANRSELGAEFFRWEAAVALLGALMGVNPFDQPDVQASKERTTEILDAYERGDAVATQQPMAMDTGWTVFADLERDEDLAARQRGTGLDAWLRAHLGRAAPPDYVAIQAFMSAQPRVQRALREIRRLLRRRCGVASTLGWGPRFLHSTGQLHKGGPGTGLFLQVTADDQQDIDVPGTGYSFGRLARAQSLGDLAALQERGRRVMRVHLSDPVAGAEALLEATSRALGGGER